ncbi:MAG: ATP-dependent Clp protease adaptor ClpS [Chloroflexota bacterium]
MIDLQTVPEVEAPPEVDIDFVVMPEEELEKPFKVIIHNDDITPYEFVIAVLCHIFELNFQDAQSVTQEAHTSGLALVTVLPYKEANERVYQAQSAARDFGYPLSFTLEPDN